MNFCILFFAVSAFMRNISIVWEWTPVGIRSGSLALLECPDVEQLCNSPMHDSWRHAAAGGVEPVAIPHGIIKVTTRIDVRQIEI